VALGRIPATPTAGLWPPQHGTDSRRDRGAGALPVGALSGFARAAGVELVHVKPHGALYNQAVRDPALAAAIARGVARFSRELILVGLAGSCLIDAAIAAGLPAASEGFADRAYQPDGSLYPAASPARCTPTRPPPRPGGQPGAAGHSHHRRQPDHYVPVDTLCIHGDTPGAVNFARAVRTVLEGAGIEVTGLRKAKAQSHLDRQTHQSIL